MDKQKEIKQKNLALLKEIISDIEKDKFEGGIVFVGTGMTHVMSRMMRLTDYMNLLSQVRDFFNDSNTGFKVTVSLDIVGTVPEVNDPIDKEYIG